MLDRYRTWLHRLFAWISLHLTPQRKPADAVLEGLQQARTIGGIVIVAVAQYRYGGISALFGYGENSVLSIFNAASIAIPVALVAMATVLGYADPDARPALLQRLRRPATTTLTVAGAIVIFVYLVPRFENVRAGAFLDLLSLCVLAVVVLFGIPGLFYASYLCAKHWFASADAHPMLPALCTILYTIVQVGINTYETTTRGPGQGLPAALSVVITFGGAPVVLVIAGYEIYRLRNLGIQFRFTAPN